MKNLTKIVLVLTLGLGLAACKGNTKKDDANAMSYAALTTPETVSVEAPTVAPVNIDIQNAEVYLSTVNFAFDRYNLSDAAKQTLAANAQILKTKAAAGKISVTVEGHTDSRGTIAYNIALGDKRANEVKKYYGLLGVDTSIINAVSYGMEKPLCAESTESCYAKNRRAETIVSAAK